MSGNLQVPWRKSGVTSRIKNWQVWCSPMRRRCTAVLNAAGGHTRYWHLLLNWPPFVQGHIIPFLLVTRLWNLFSLCLSCWILLCSFKYLHMLCLLKINAVDSEWTLFNCVLLLEWVEFISVNSPRVKKYVKGASLSYFPACVVAGRFFWIVYVSSYTLMNLPYTIQR